MPIGPGPDDPENDNYDPAWHDQDTPFRRWIASKLAARNGVSPEFATVYAPANRYHGLNDEAENTISLITGTSPEEVREAHTADLADWKLEQQLRDHPDLAVVDADLNRIQQR
ncbi:hypothetical protein [Streptomyces halstedii]|uniref:Uncharacterized protein n=1 Tax=Streptomyces halstedii TaxID=1944 RepID=A0A6N9UDK1_STRHA|nr:hypothetical protein [Streptomyces halstedii]NEA20183.1 hypothetical protein [Streptomyces halstedii]